MAGKLVIAPTPIGNLGDITLRTLDALRDADTVCAEDTRVTGKLLAALGVQGKRIERLDENVMAQRAAALVERVQNGEVIAYCSDAGMPGVSDPGLRLVAAVREADVPVEVLPGPSASVTAYVASGTTAGAFYFGGFFPRKDKARADLLESLRSLDAALVFYESPKRLVGALQAIAAAYSRRQVVVCRELTKMHEEVVRGAADELATAFAKRDSVKGEIVIVIEPSTSDDACAIDPATVHARAAELAAQGERSKAIAKQLAQEFGISRNDAYNAALETGRSSQTALTNGAGKATAESPMD